jgi:hypothetical protein
VVEACFAHKEGDPVRRACCRASFAVERAALLRAWAAYCCGVAPVKKAAPKRKASVVPMLAAA